MSSPTREHSKCFKTPAIGRGFLSVGGGAEGNRTP